MFFFLLWPLFARAPRHWFLENFLLSAPGVQRVFFFVALRWAPRPFGGASAKKKTPPRVFFFLLRPRGKAGEGEAPCRAGTGPEQKKKTPPRVFFFCCGLGERQRKEKPRWAPAAGPQQKKNTTQGVFFLLRPRGKAGEGEAPCRHGARAKKKHHPGCFFFCCGPARTGVVFFVLLWPRPDSHSLTVGWGDFGKARVVFFFLLRPRRVFLDNSKKCLGYYIGSKKTRRGHSKKKNTTSMEEFYKHQKLKVGP